MCIPSLFWRNRSQRKRFDVSFKTSVWNTNVLAFVSFEPRGESISFFTWKLERSHLVSCNVVFNLEDSQAWKHSQPFQLLWGWHHLIFVLFFFSIRLSLTLHLCLFHDSGQNVTIKSLSINKLIPNMDSYMTYEGSLTIPGCSETVTWIVINKPIFITRQQVTSGHV